LTQEGVSKRKTKILWSLFNVGLGKKFKKKKGKSWEPKKHQVQETQAKPGTRSKHQKKLHQKNKPA